MTTASQLIDIIATELLRPDFRTQGVFTSYLNQVVRELHSHPSTGAPILFENNLLEITVPVSALPFVWAIPKISRFQQLATAKDLTTGEVFRRRRIQHVAERLNESSYYRTGTAFAFASPSLDVGSQIALAYYEYPRGYTYLAAAARKVSLNLDTETFTYAPELTTDEQKAAALDAESCWCIWQWPELVKQGIRAKVWARLGEVERARTAYSAYQSMRLEMLAQETYDLEELR